jgi:two-component sensor histidine kinase
MPVRLFSEVRFAAAGGPFMTIPSGIDGCGPLSWGTHFCQLYETADDMAEVLVGYFRAGIEANEACLWIASAPLPVRSASAALRRAVPDLDRRIASGQVEIVDRRGWLVPPGGSPAAILDRWREREALALAAGHSGLRIAGPSMPADRAGREGALACEAAVSQGCRGRRIVALCSCRLSRCGASGIFDAVTHHAFALARHAGGRTMLERADHRQTRAELYRLNDELDARVRERTRHLLDVLADKDALLREVRHRVRNNLQVVISLLRARQRRVRAPEARAALEDSIGRVHALALVEDEVYGDQSAAEVDMAGYLARLCAHLAEIHGDGGRVTVRVEVDPVSLDLDRAVPIGLVAHELVGNAFRHAFPGGRSGRIVVTLGPMADGRAELTVRDDGIGAPAALEGLPAGAGLRLAAHVAGQSGGALAIDSGTPGGTTCRLRFPLRPSRPVP